MNNNDKLYNLYLQLEPTIAELEEARKSALIVPVLLGAVVCLLFTYNLLSWILKGTSHFSIFTLIFWLPLFSLLAFVIFQLVFTICYYFSSPKEKYEKAFKETIISSLIENLLIDSPQYFPEEFLDFFTIKNSCIWKEFNNYSRSKSNYRFDRGIYWLKDHNGVRSGLTPHIYYDGSDLISGKNFKCSQLHISPGSGLSNYTFKSLFIIIDLPKNTNTAFGTSNNISDNKILLDNPEFNELFPVYAEDITEAFYILPSNLLERMVNFVHKTGRKFDFSVVDDKFYIAIPIPWGDGERQLLEPPLFKSLFDYSIYEEYLADLDLILGIVEDLKLA